MSCTLKSMHGKKSAAWNTGRLSRGLPEVGQKGTLTQLGEYSGEMSLRTPTEIPSLECYLRRCSRSLGADAVPGVSCYVSCRFTGEDVGCKVV